MNVARCTLERLEDLCKTELRSMPTTLDTSHSRAKLSLLIVTLITTCAGSKRQFIQDFTLTTSTGIVE